MLRGWADRFRAKLPEVRAALEAVVRVDTLQARALWGPSWPRPLPPSWERTRGCTSRSCGTRCWTGTCGRWARPRSRSRSRWKGRPGARPLRTQRGREDGGPEGDGPGRAGGAGGSPRSRQGGAAPRLRRALRADIGDHQSIEADLSTFSAHVQAVARFLEEARPPCLVLFDEIGTGTEPNEGAAIARAVLERADAARGHDARHRTWGRSRPGRCRPRGRLGGDGVRHRAPAPHLPRAPGDGRVSAGLEIAQRMGVPQEVLTRARAPGPEAERSELHGPSARAPRSSRLVGTRWRSGEAALEEAPPPGLPRGGALCSAGGEADKVLGDALRRQGAGEPRVVAAIKDKTLRARLEREQAKARCALQARARTHKERVGAPAAPLQQVTKLPGSSPGSRCSSARWSARARSSRCGTARSSCAWGRRRSRWSGRTWRRWGRRQHLRRRGARCRA